MTEISGPSIPLNDALVGREISLGDAVTIFTLCASGPLIEGKGIVECVSAVRNEFWIKFDGDPIARLRFIHPDWQASPERSLVLLQEFWRSCGRDNSRVEDFFPPTEG